MKRNLLLILIIFILSLIMQSLYAETADNFNSRAGVPLASVKGFLQGNCWFFSDFDVNRNGWAPNMEGDGAMVSGAGASATEMTGIYTPLLEIKGNTTLSFSYKFDLPVHDRRWIRVFATDATNKSLFLLDSLELTGSGNSDVYSYHKSLTVPASGAYKLYINYQGIGGNERIAIDQLTIDATAHYQGACNASPVAQRDKFTGDAAHTASGNVLNNDYDPNQEKLTAYLLTDSPDGTVDLQHDGSFVFTPKAGFSGSNTHFSYKTCDNGYPALCSVTMTASIHFPSASSHAGLVSFHANYRKNAVDIDWNTVAASNNDRFEVERSLDGNNFEKIGEGDHAFTDKVHSGMARKNDLYYRLRQIDAANRVFYSKVMIVRMYESKHVTAVSVTPDPGVNDIQVNVQLKEKSFVVLKVTDNKGDEVFKKTGFGEFGANRYEIEGTSQLQPGMYQLEVIINSNERMTMKLAKS